MGSHWQSNWSRWQDGWSASGWNGEDEPQAKQSWQTAKSWNTAPQTPASCRGWGAYGSQEHPSLSEADRAQKWSWADQTKDWDAQSRGMSWTWQNWNAKMAPQGSPKARPQIAQSSNNNKGAPQSAQRWFGANHLKK